MLSRLAKSAGSYLRCAEVANFKKLLKMSGDFDESFYFLINLVVRYFENTKHLQMLL